MKLNRITMLPVAALAALTLALTACGSGDGTAGSESAGDTSAQWPRTIEVPAGTSEAAGSVTIANAPQRIAALDYESAEVLAELDLAERVVLIPEAVLSPVLGSHVEELQRVESTFPVALEIEAEAVISLAPDLVILSPRHGNETPIAEVLEQAGVPVLRLPESWVDTAATLANIRLIGEATGSEIQAEALASAIESGLEAEQAVDVAGATADSSEQPRVLLLTNQAGRPFVTAGRAYPVELLEGAGAANAATEIGIERTGAITVEQVVQLNPDGIVLIDMNGSGDRMFQELLENAAVAALPAVADDRILRVDGKQVQALGLTATVDGLAQLTKWVHTL